ncbi:MAG: DUF4394 domain-containing protein [Gemmatimonadaceae bacterium]
MLRSFRTMYSLIIAASNLGSLGCGLDAAVGVDANIDVAGMLAGGPPPASADQEPVVFAADSRNRLVAFTESRPGRLIYSATIAGMASSEAIVGLDFRASNGKLYGISSSGRVYVFDQRGPSGTAVSATAVAEVSGRSDVGFDFNPTVDRIRIHGSGGLNLRVHPDLGVLVAVDLPLRYVSGDVSAAATAEIVATAYTNGDYNGGTAPTSTTLFALDARGDALVTFAAPNDGQMRTIGELGVKFTSQSSMDIARGSSSAIASLTAEANASASTLYRIDLTNGRAQAVGRIGGDATIRAIAARR